MLYKNYYIKWAPTDYYIKRTPGILTYARFDSSIMFSFIRGGIFMPMGDFPEGLTRATSVGTMSVGRLGVVNEGGGARAPEWQY